MEKGLLKFDGNVFNMPRLIFKFWVFHITNLSVKGLGKPLKLCGEFFEICLKLDVSGIQHSFVWTFGYL